MPYLQHEQGPVPAHIVRGLRGEQVRENDTIILKALFQGNPTPRVSWYKNSMPLIMSERHSTHVEEMKHICGLKIRNAKRDDAGVYSVVVENPYGQDDSSAQVNIVTPEDLRPRIPSTSVATPLVNAPLQSIEQKQREQNAPPRVIRHMQPETQVTEGGAVHVSALIEGVPTPQISYLKNEQPLAASSRIKTSYNVNTGVVTLVIEDVNVYDAGAYKIRAENAFGKAETAGVIYVNPTSGIDARPVVDPNAFRYLPPQQQPQQPQYQQPQPQRSTARVEPHQQDVPMGECVAPNFVVGLSPNVKIHEGEPVKLVCQVEGQPKPTVSFRIYLHCI
jgi:hypothetical protein